MGVTPLLLDVCAKPDRLAVRVEPTLSREIGVRLWVSHDKIVARIQRLENRVELSQQRCNMTIADKIFAEVSALPDAQAREVLDFVGFLKSRQGSRRLAERAAALAELARYRGRFKAVKFSRDELYDRACIR